MKSLPKFDPVLTVKKRSSSATICLLICLLLSLSVLPGKGRAHSLSYEDRELLQRIARDSFQYFVRNSDKQTGLTRDSTQPGSPASIAATGFSLAAFAVAQARGWVDPLYARQYLEKTLHALLHKAAHQNGFFYHFLDGRTGKRVWDSEASSIDTALLVAGALLAAEYFPDTSIETMAHQIYNRVDWNWMMNGSDFLCMGWKPQGGFLPYYWDSYSEHLILQALAIGAKNNPISPSSWGRWMRHREHFRDDSIVYSASGSLFTYQYAHAFIDFRDLNDEGTNYFENSRLATEANRDYSLGFRNQFRSYSENSWGLSACLGPGGYRAYGGKPGEGLHDGTIAPYAALSSIIFTPELSAQTVRHFYESYGSLIYGPFGFKDGFNLDKNWWCSEYIGIDQGISILMIENFLHDGAVWKKFMNLDAIQRWIALTDIGPRDSAAAS
jgi:hypothetical protein